MTTVMPSVFSRSARRSAASVAKSSAEELSSKISTAGRPTSARAMVSRWRCPPEKLRPAVSTGSSSPPGLPRTKSAAWAISSAAQICSSVASGQAQRMLSRMVPVNSIARCGTMPTRRRSCAKEYSFTSWPNSLTQPDPAS